MRHTQDIILGILFSLMGVSLLAPENPMGSFKQYRSISFAMIHLSCDIDPCTLVIRQEMNLFKLLI